MKLLFASDSFKGTISSEESADMLTRAAHEVLGDDVQCSSISMADGGEGTTDAVIKAVGGHRITVDVHGPLMEPVKAYYGALSSKRAIIEMATASGLPMVPEDLRNPLNTTTYGTGELIKDALQRGYTDIYIAIGGSATNDGGMGCMSALGVRFLDAEGNVLEGRGCDLERVANIDASGICPLLNQASITVMCDVTNPLCGPDGATYTFGRQKGATPEIQARLEAGMCNYRDVIIRSFGINPDEIAGSGAAGGLGAALLVFLKGSLQSGIEAVLELNQFDSLLADTDLVVTGEGRTDWQSCFGKVLQGVGDHCQRHGVPAVALVGAMGEGAEKIFEHGISSIITTVADPRPLAEILEPSYARAAYYSGAIRMFRLIKAGMTLSTPK